MLWFSVKTLLNSGVKMLWYSVKILFWPRRKYFVIQRKDSTQLRRKDAVIQCKDFAQLRRKYFVIQRKDSTQLRGKNAVIQWPASAPWSLTLNSPIIWLSIFSIILSTLFYSRHNQQPNFTSYKLNIWSISYSVFMAESPLIMTLPPKIVIIE